MWDNICGVLDNMTYKLCETLYVPFRHIRKVAEHHPKFIGFVRPPVSCSKSPTSMKIRILGTATISLQNFVTSLIMWYGQICIRRGAGRSKSREMLSNISGCTEISHPVATNSPAGLQAVSSLRINIIGSKMHIQLQVRLDSSMMVCGVCGKQMYYR